MDFATHALASFAIARGFFPRRPWPVLVGILLAGTLADLDLLSSFFGPSAYLHAHRAVTHSLIATTALIAIATLITVYFSRKEEQPLAVVLAATSCAASAHVLFDLLESDGVALLWPFNHSRYAADILPGIDPWILVVMLAGVALPELFRLVGSEIGAKNKSPRGRNGALIALSFTVLYGSRFDPETNTCLHKPDPSPALSAAQSTPAAKLFLQSARFPRATVEKTLDGYLIVIRAAEDHAQNATRRSVHVLITTDLSGKVLAQSLAWAPTSREAQQK